VRLGLVIYGSLDTLSGGYLYDRRLVEYLRAQGDVVEIVSMPWKGYAGHLVQNFEPAWLRRLGDLNIDLLLQDELNHPSLAWFNSRLRQTTAIPIVSIVHHLRGSEAHPAGILWFYRQVERKYLRSVDGFVFNSRTTRAVVESNLQARPPGIVATPGGDRFGVGLRDEEIRERLERPGPLGLLFVGNLIPRKGLDHLLYGLAKLKGKDWRLRVAGRMDADRVYANKIQSLAERLGLGDQVVFLGRLDENQLECELRHAHVLAVPSQYEGFGIVYLEGMGFGLPGLASRSGAAGEIIQNGENGWLVDPGDAGQIADCLGDIVQDREELRRMSHAARRRFSDFPGWEESAASIRAFLAEMV
jgi:glycosyltransferase involved in cell wall biosynthesis